MKNHTSSRPFGGLGAWLMPLLMIVAIFACMSPPAQAAPRADVELSSLVLPDGTTLLAQIDAPAPAVTAQPATVQPSTPWYADGAFVGGIFTAIMAIFGIWSHKERTTAQKVSASLVEAIEVATKIPGVAEKEKAIKQAINRKVTELGVQPLVHRIVKDVTEPGY